MQCDRARELLSAFRDGELSPDERRAVAAHVEACKDCSEILADYDRIGQSLRRRGRTAAPSALAGDIRAALDRMDADAPIFNPRLIGWRPFRAGSKTASGIAKRVAALAAACFVSALVTWSILDATRRAGDIEREVLSGHIRSLLQDSPVQVASSDQHTVRPWFAGRTDFAPAVRDLTAEGYTLIGGRLDYVADRRVGVVVYKRRQHVINVFMWPASATADGAARLATRNGYNLLSWSLNGVTYWAVSDLNAGEMRELQRLL